jgi:hypothetical protein
MSISDLLRLPRIPQILRSQECPLCSSIEFREDIPQPLDRLLSVFAFRPVRCVNCWRRYYQFAPKPKIARTHG